MSNSGKKLRIVVVGAGVRGSNLAKQISYSEFPAEIVAVAEPNECRRNTFAQKYSLPNKSQFISYKDLLESSIKYDAAIIATMDNQHTDPIISFLRKSCHILIEKPLTDKFDDGLKILKEHKKSNRILSVCHTLRYVDAFRQIKQIIDDCTIGKIIHVDHMEAIGHFRFTHNYVRGRWSKEENNTFLLLHKCCHDIDYLAWLLNENCKFVSSFGSLTYFQPSKAPIGSAQHCYPNCNHLNSCPYSALNVYIKNDLTDRLGDLCGNASMENLFKAITNGPFGVCVWHADNNVVDHQTVSMEFENGITVNFILSGYSSTHGRKTIIQGTEGEILFDEAGNTINIKKFSGLGSKQINIQDTNTYHPEDKEIVNNWLSAISNPNCNSINVNAEEALKTLAIVFAAELSRKEKRTIEMTEFYDHIKN